MVYIKKKLNNLYIKNHTFHTKKVNRSVIKSFDY